MLVCLTQIDWKILLPPSDVRRGNTAEITASAFAPASSKSAPFCASMPRSRPAAPPVRGAPAAINPAWLPRHRVLPWRQKAAERHVIRAQPYRLMRQRHAIIARPPTSLPLPAARAHSATLPSAPPRCTPSASTCCANSASSLTISGTANSRVSSRNASACSRRNAAAAILLRYWHYRAPPSNARRTLRSNSAVSASSGVIAYKPLITILST